MMRARISKTKKDTDKKTKRDRERKEVKRDPQRKNRHI